MYYILYLIFWLIYAMYTYLMYIYIYMHMYIYTHYKHVAPLLFVFLCWSDGTVLALGHINCFESTFLAFS